MADGLLWLLWLFQSLLDDRVCPREISYAMSH